MPDDVGLRLGFDERHYLRGRQTREAGRQCCEPYDGDVQILVGCTADTEIARLRSEQHVTHAVEDGMAGSGGFHFEAHERLVRANRVWHDVTDDVSVGDKHRLVL